MLTSTATAVLLDVAAAVVSSLVPSLLTEDCTHVPCELPPQPDRVLPAGQLKSPHALHAPDPVAVLYWPAPHVSHVPPEVPEQALRYFPASHPPHGVHVDPDAY